MSIEERLQRLEAIEAIRALKARYLNACDLKNLEQIRSCFVEDGLYLDYGVIGRFDHVEQLIRLFDEKANHPHIFDSHHAANAEIEILSDIQAKARWALAFIQLNQAENTMTRLSGFYQDEYRCEQGQWLISRSEFVVSSTLLTRLDDERRFENLVFAAPA